MRTFVAIELNEQCRENLAAALGKMRTVAEGVRWVDPEIAHLTVKFIGDLAQERVGEVVAAMQKVAGGVEPFAMEVAGLGSFPPRGRPRVLYAAVEEPEGRLRKLAADLEETLEREVGVERDGREFIPHVTLGRTRRGRKCPPVGELCGLLEELSFGRVDVGSVVLMKSELTPEGPVYSELHRAGLGAE